MLLHKLYLIIKSWDYFKENANILSFNMQSISTAANSQAASLEETAASLEEITSNITNNTQTTTKMASYGEK